MGIFISIISILCGAVAFCKGQTIGNPLPSAFFEEQITGGRHPNDDKRYTIEQLNLAARHRNVYYDTVGGDPYGHSSPVLSRSHIAVNHKKKRSIMQPESAQTFGGSQLPSAFFEEQIIGGRHPADDKRYTIEQLNQAARHRNVYFDTVGGDPYGHSSPVLTRSHIAVNHKKRRSVSQGELSPAAGAISQYYPAVQSSPSNVQETVKRDGIARLNYAARHRNVYFDSVGGDPYGGSSTVLTRQHILVNHSKRSAEEKDTKTRETLKKKLRIL